MTNLFKVALAATLLTCGLQQTLHGNPHLIRVFSKKVGTETKKVAFIGIAHEDHEIQTHQPVCTHAKLWTPAQPLHEVPVR